MSVKTSISLSDQQNEYARKLVDEGQYSSISAVLQTGLELLKAQTESQNLETNALRHLLQLRMNGEFENEVAFSARVTNMLKAKALESSE